jgi:hypothetical protein
MEGKRIGAPPGNKFGLAIKDPQTRQEAYKEYCEHLAKGKSKRSWRCHIPGVHCTWETMEKYIRNAEEFDPIHKQIAEIDGYCLWEDIVSDSARGTNKDANTASLQMVMRNKFGWDKKEEGEKEYDQHTSQMFDGLMGMFRSAQSSSNKDTNNPNTA